MVVVAFAAFHCADSGRLRLDQSSAQSTAVLAHAALQFSAVLEVSAPWGATTGAQLRLVCGMSFLAIFETAVCWLRAHWELKCSRIWRHVQWSTKQRA